MGLNKCTYSIGDDVRHQKQVPIRILKMVLHRIHDRRHTCIKRFILFHEVYLSLADIRTNQRYSSSTQIVAL